MVLISYIFIDASGWVISDVSFGFMRGFGSYNIRPPHPNDPVGIDLTPTPIPAAKLRIHTRQMTTEIALSLLILQQTIRVRLLWWFLNLSFKIGRPLCSCFPVTMISLFSYLFNLVCDFFSFSIFFFSFFFSPFCFPVLLITNYFFAYGSIEYKWSFVLHMVQSNWNDFLVCIWFNQIEMIFWFAYGSIE